MTIELTPKDALELRLLLEWLRVMLARSRTMEDERELRRGVEVMEKVLKGIEK